MKKTLAIGAIGFALLVAASGCGNKEEHKIDTQIGVSALVALADSHIRGYLNSMEAVAMTQEVQSGDWGEMAHLLSKVEEGQVPATVWFVLPDGSYFTVELGKTDKNLSDRPYFPGLMAGNSVLGDLVVSRSTGKKSLIVTVPVKREGKVIGGLGASIFLDDLSEILAEELKLPDGMVFYAVTEKDEVALHSDTALILEENPELSKNVVFAISQLTQWRFALGFKE